MKRMSRSIYEEASEKAQWFKYGLLVSDLDIQKVDFIQGVLKQAQKQEQELNQLQQDISTMIQSLSKRNIIIKAFDNVELQAFKRIDDVCVKHLQKL